MTHTWIIRTRRLGASEWHVIVDDIDHDEMRRFPTFEDAEKHILAHMPRTFEAEILKINLH